MEYDKINGDVAFLEGPHKYFNVKDPSITYISVTTLIEKYGKPYDKEFWSKYKALERILSPNDWKGRNQQNGSEEYSSYHQQ